MNKPLHEKDFFAWTQAQADALRRRSSNELDWDHLVEEVQDMGARDRRELTSRLIQLYLHLLKWTHQPERRGASWARSIHNQQTEIPILLKQSPSLKAQLDELLLDAYDDARAAAARETGLPFSIFSQKPLMPLDQALEIALDWDGSNDD